MEHLSGQEEWIRIARDDLARFQNPDGSVSVAPDIPTGFWPTPLAVMAWHSSLNHRSLLENANDFLLREQGTVITDKEATRITGHDTTIVGWPWISKTHSWVEPTCLALYGFYLSGLQDHSRSKEGRRLLVDRQLPGGGWNYGNTTVFGKELQPMPLSTGMALTALQGFVEEPSISKSVQYLRGTVDQLRSPLSLGWAILGLSAWDQRPANAQETLSSCFETYLSSDAFRLDQIAILVLAYLGDSGFIELLRSEEA
jgi:hypothetical protein